MTHRERADRLEAGDQDHEVDDDGEDRSPDEEVCEFHQRSSTLGVGSVRRLNRVVDLNGGAVPQLEHAGGHDFVTGLDAGEHRDLVAARAARA